MKKNVLYLLARLTVFAIACGVGSGCDDPQPEPFGLGSTKQDVRSANRRLIVTETKVDTNGEHWIYNDGFGHVSTVDFGSDGKVTGWDNVENRLNVEK